MSDAHSDGMGKPRQVPMDEYHKGCPHTYEAHLRLRTKDGYGAFKIKYIEINARIRRFTTCGHRCRVKEHQRVDKLYDELRYGCNVRGCKCPGWRMQRGGGYGDWTLREDLAKAGTELRD